MFRSLVPSLESLEKREVLSAGPLAFASHTLLTPLPSAEATDVAVVSPRDAASGLPTGIRSQSLPFVGLPVVGDWNGDGIDDLGIVNRQAAAAHDAVFTEIATKGFGDSVDTNPPQILIGMLLPAISKPVSQLTVDPGNPNVAYAKEGEFGAVENDETHGVGDDRTRVHSLLVSAVRQGPMFEDTDIELPIAVDPNLIGMAKSRSSGVATDPGDQSGNRVAINKDQISTSVGADATNSLVGQDQETGELVVWGSVFNFGTSNSTQDRRRSTHNFAWWGAEEML